MGRAFEILFPYDLSASSSPLLGLEEATMIPRRRKKLTPLVDRLACFELRIAPDRTLRGMQHPRGTRDSEFALEDARSKTRKIWPTSFHAVNRTEH